MSLIIHRTQATQMEKLGITEKDILKYPRLHNVKVFSDLEIYDGILVDELKNLLNTLADSDYIEFCYDGYGVVCWEVVHLREETDSEYVKRVIYQIRAARELKNKKQKQEEYELQIYEKLKKKYGG
jgi:hypothetical protein